MIANFFNQTKPINFLVLSGLAILLFSMALLVAQPTETGSYLIAKYTTFLLLSVLMIFILNFIIRKNALCEDNSYALLITLIYFGIFPQAFMNGGIFVSNFVLLFAFRRMYSMRTTLEPREKIFDSAFWIGVATLFYLWSGLYLILLYLAIWLFRRGDARRILIPIVGFLTPIFLAYVYLLAFDDSERFYALWNFDLQLGWSAYANWQFALAIGLTLVLTFMAIVPTVKKSLLAKMDFKSTWQLLMSHLAISVFIVLIAPLKDGSEFLFVFFPLGILLANYMQMLKRYWFKEMLIYVLLLTVVLVNF